jgi:UTP-glucose-1-phosphate uridylyltransferase
VKTALVVLAAGIGSRYGGIKQLEAVGPGGETILEYSLFDARRAGFSEVIFVIRKAMENDFRTLLLDRMQPDLSVKLAYQETGFLPPPWAASESARNRVKPWGTAHALWCARESIECPFAVINADDFYGYRSYALLQGFLAGSKADSTDYAMVGFELGKTLSDHGPVARGICGIDSQGLLVDIVEHTRLAALKGEAPDSRIASLGADASRTFFPADTAVSMNLFGFTPRIFPSLEALLAVFLATSAEDAKAEFYLPGAVQNLVKSGSATVRVLRSPETWFGLTYKPDIEGVRDELRQLVESGLYPYSLRTAAKVK